MNSARLLLRVPVLFFALAAAIFISPLALSQTAPALSPKVDPRIDAIIQRIGETRYPLQAAISPDGTTVAWSVETEEGSQIHLTDIANPDPAREKIVTTGNGATDCSSDDPVWSPDGQSLAFTSTCTSSQDKAGQAEIFLWSTKTGTAKQLTHLTGEIQQPAWSPDGKSIAFLFVENATRQAGATSAMKPWSGVIGEEGLEIQGVYRMDIATGQGKWFVPPSSKMYVFEFSWAPDSKRIAFVGAPAPGENNWWIAKLYTAEQGNSRCVKNDPFCLPTGGGLSEYQILDPTTISGSLHNLQIADPRWSPDGKQIAFIGGLMSDQGSTGGDIYLIPSTGGQPKDITPNRAASVSYLSWVSPQILGFTEHVGGKVHLAAINLDTGSDVDSVDVTIPASIHANGLVMSVSVSNVQTIAFIRTSFERGPEVWAGSIDDLKQITHLNDSVKPLWGKSESVEWTNEGFHIQGWLLYPANYDPAKKYPLLVYIHGGPSAAVTPRWPSIGYGGVPFSALGYFVFMPNPRGSFGQGEKFTQANVRDFGYGDLRDTLAGMDTLEKRLPIDKNREGITGWSYGGFMTMFAVTQTTRFKAAVAGAGISDWKSYYGENSIDQWMIPFFGKSVYDDPAVYAKSSAINYIKNVRTPTLIVVGDRDGECPAPQSFEFWHALRAEGVKTRLVVYPNEGHHIANIDHRRDILERALNWFETEMPQK